MIIFESPGEAELKPPESPLDKELRKVFYALPKKLEDTNKMINKILSIVSGEN